jgi:hypothetical protein
MRISMRLATDCSTYDVCRFADVGEEGAPFLGVPSFNLRGVRRSSPVLIVTIKSTSYSLEENWEEKGTSVALA